MVVGEDVERGHLRQVGSVSREGLDQLHSVSTGEVEQSMFLGNEKVLGRVERVALGIPVVYLTKGARRRYDSSWFLS